MTICRSQDGITGHNYDKYINYLLLSIQTEKKACGFLQFMHF